MQSIVQYAETILCMFVSLLAALHCSRMPYSKLHAADLEFMLPVFLIQPHGLCSFWKEDSGFSSSELFFTRLHLLSTELGSAVEGASDFRVEYGFIYRACNYYNVS